MKLHDRDIPVWRTWTDQKTNTLGRGRGPRGLQITYSGTTLSAVKPGPLSVVTPRDGVYRVELRPSRPEAHPLHLGEQYRQPPGPDFAAWPVTTVSIGAEGIPCYYVYEILRTALWCVRNRRGIDPGDGTIPSILDAELDHEIEMSLNLAGARQTVYEAEWCTPRVEEIPLGREPRLAGWLVGTLPMDTHAERRRDMGEFVQTLKEGMPDCAIPYWLARVISMGSCSFETDAFGRRSLQLFHGSTQVDARAYLFRTFSAARLAARQTMIDYPLARLHRVTGSPGWLSPLIWFVGWVEFPLSFHHVDPYASQSHSRRMYVTLDLPQFKSKDAWSVPAVRWTDAVSVSVMDNLPRREALGGIFMEWADRYATLVAENCQWAYNGPDRAAFVDAFTDALHCHAAVTLCDTDAGGATPLGAALSTVGVHAAWHEVDEENPYRLEVIARRMMAASERSGRRNDAYWRRFMEGVFPERPTRALDYEALELQLASAIPRLRERTQENARRSPTIVGPPSHIEDLRAWAAEEEREVEQVFAGTQLRDANGTVIGIAYEPPDEQGYVRAQRILFVLDSVPDTGPWPRQAYRRALFDDGSWYDLVQHLHYRPGAPA